jgi:hypothetical protein
MHGQKTFIYQVSEWYSQGTRHLCVQMEACWIYSGVSIIHKGWDGGGGRKGWLLYGGMKMEVSQVGSGLVSRHSGVSDT